MDAELLVGVQRACAPVASLHLIDHQQNVIRVAKLLRLLDERRVKRNHAAFALHHLHQQPADLARAEDGFQRGNVVRGRVTESRRERAEVLMEAVLPGRRQRRNRAAVEAVHQCHDNVAVVLLAVFPGDFQRTFIRLRAGIAEENLLHARALAQQLCQLRLRFGIVEVRRVTEGGQLMRHGGDPVGIARAEERHADARAEVDVALAVGAFVVRALAFRHHRVKAAVCAGDVSTVRLFNFLAHNFPQSPS